jgi:microcystin degradation protein MlrC
VGGFKHELNSFAAGTMSFEDIRRSGYYAEGADIFDAPESDRPELAAVRHFADREGWDLVPTVHFWAAYAGGPIEHAVYERAKELIVGAAMKHRDRLSAVMLPLHGATVTTREEDPEGDLLIAVRDVVGPDVPIAATFDTHAHGTSRMASAASALVGFKTHPHTDHYATATLAMDILRRAIRGEVRPVTAHRKIRMMTSSERQNTDTGPQRELIDFSRELERRPGVLAVSLFTTQPWMDVPAVGWSVEVVTDDDPVLAQATADELAHLAWSRRERFLVHKTPISAALDRAAASGKRPIILADGSDSCTAGGNGDGTELLAALMERSDSLNALLTVTDPVAVAACAGAGIGATVDIPVGATMTPFFAPVAVSGTVQALALGTLQLDPPWAPTDIGRMAVLRAGSVDIVLSERKPWHLDTAVYRHVGCDPSRYQVVQVKSAGGFRARYAPIAAEIIEIETTGPCDSDLPRLPFRRITRPLWPFDPDLEAGWPSEH